MDETEDAAHHEDDVEDGPADGKRRNKRVTHAILLIGLAATIAAAFAGNMPSAEEKAATLLAQMKTASGGAALDAASGFHEVGTGTRDGAAMTYETWGDLRTLRSATTHSLGGHTVSGGFDGKVSWSVGPDGVAHTEATAEALSSARLGTYLTIGAYFYPDRFPAHAEYRGQKQADGKSFDVVTVTPKDGVPVDLWLDTATHRLQRISGSDGKETFSGVVDRYQQVEGAWIAFSLTQIEGTHKTALNLTSFAFEAVPAARFSPPAK